MVLGRLVKRAEVTAQRDAETILADAKAQAAKLRAEAQNIKNNAEAEGYQRGYARGEAKGLDDGVAKALGQLVTEGRANHPARAATGAQVWQLARKMAEKVLGNLLAVSPESEQALVAQAVRMVRPKGAQDIRIRVAPERLATLNAAKSALLERLEVQVNVTFVGDAAVSGPGCVVETDTVSLDARLETQLDALEKAMQSALENGSENGPKNGPT